MYIRCDDTYDDSIAALTFSCVSAVVAKRGYRSHLGMPRLPPDAVRTRAGFFLLRMYGSERTGARIKMLIPHIQHVAEDLMAVEPHVVCSVLTI